MTSEGVGDIDAFFHDGAQLARDHIYAPAYNRFMMVVMVMIMMGSDGHGNGGYLSRGYDRRDDDDNNGGDDGDDGEEVKR